MGRPQRTTVVDITGKKFGKLLVIRRAGSLKYRTQSHATWIVKCECGKEKEIAGYLLRGGNTKTCGCWKRQGIESDIHNLFIHYRRSAIRRKYDFKLSETDFSVLVVMPCVYCGKNLTGKLNGVDRLNSKIGYVKENCVSCCSMCNRAKGTLSKEEFLNLAKSIYEVNFGTL